MKALVLAAALLVLSLSQGAVMGADDHESHHETAQTANASWTNGEVRRVDKSAGKLTLRHEAIKNLDMPPMTMVFRAKDAAMLDSVKAGDKVRFVAEQVGGDTTVTHLEKAP